MLLALNWPVSQFLHYQQPVYQQLYCFIKGRNICLLHLLHVYYISLITFKKVLSYVIFLFFTGIFVFFAYLLDVQTPKNIYSLIFL